MNELASVIGICVAVLNIIATLGGGLIFITRMNARLDVQHVQIKALQLSTETVAKIVTSSAVAEQKLVTHGEMIATLQRQLEDLRRGDGFITAKHHA